MRDRSLALDLPVHVGTDAAGDVVLSTGAALDRAALGLGHSPLGMVRGPLAVHVTVV